METLTVDVDFPGFTPEQIMQIARGAKHFKGRGRRAAKWIPTCSIAGETFEILQVRSRGLQHSVRRRDSDTWVSLDQPAVIRWQVKGTPWDRPTVAPPTLLSLSETDVRERVSRALNKALDARTLTNDAAQMLWGVEPTTADRDLLNAAYQTLTHAIKNLRHREDELRPKS